MPKFAGSNKGMNEIAIRYTFRKAEKLCSQKLIDELFAKGKSLFFGQFRLVYLEMQAFGKPPLKVLMAVPKKNLRHAVCRNRMKRLMRESYRMNKQKVEAYFDQSGKNCSLAIVFMGKEVIGQAQTNAAIIQLLMRLIKTHEKTSG